MSKYLTLFMLSILLISQLYCNKVSQKSVMWGELSPGAYGVGFRVRTFFDTNRDDIDKADNSRPIEVMIWYPTELRTKVPKLNFRNYLLLVPELQNDSDQSKIQEWLSTSMRGDTSGVSRGTLDIILETQMQAVLDAPTMNQQFPLVLWTMRHETMVAQSILCEYLASHGYVVAYARYGGASLPLPWQIQTATEKLNVFSEHLKDLNFALERLSSEPDVTPTTASIITWSYAFELAPLMQLRNPAVKLVIGLSSNPFSLSGLYQGDEAGSNLKSDSLDVPYVYMKEQFGFDGKKLNAPAIMDKLPTDAYYLSFSKLGHGNFNALEGMVPALFGVSNIQSWSKSGQNAKLGYETISRYTLHFLDTYLKQGGQYYRPKWEKQLPESFVKVTQHGKFTNKK